MRRLVLAALVSLVALGSEAAPITHYFAGTVVGSASGVFADQGTAILGSYTYDTDLTDLLPGDSSMDLFSSHTPGANQGLAFDITVSLGDVTYSSSNNAGVSGTQHHFLQILDGAEDRFMFDAVRTVDSDDFIRLLLRDLPQSGTPDGIAPGTGTLSDRPFDTVLDASAFQGCTDLSFACYSMVDAYDETGGREGAFFFQIDALMDYASMEAYMSERLALTQIPEPYTFGLLIFGLIGVGLGRRHSPSR